MADKQMQWTVTGKRPELNDPNTVDRLFSMVMALTSEVGVLRHRLDSMQKLAESHGWLAADALENYMPDLDERKDREAWREAFLGRVLYIFEEEMADLERGETKEAYWNTIEDIEKGDS
ncbi:MAG: hypothetical protein AAF221_10380 [Pseudomonadota bacterium]